MFVQIQCKGGGVLQTVASDFFEDKVHAEMWEKQQYVYAS